MPGDAEVAAGPGKNPGSYGVALVLAAVLALWPAPGLTQKPSSSPLAPLWFSLQPEGEGRPAQGGRPPVAGHTGGRPSGRPSGRPGAGHGSRFESEHRAVPVRHYYLRGPAPAAGARGFVLHPDLTVDELDLFCAETAGVVVRLPMTDGPLHGANNVYAVDRQVVGRTLVVRCAKWLTIHHSCGWGHGLRHDPSRHQARHLDDLPLEIVVEGLWDGNFHSKVMSGDVLQLQVLRHGRPAPGARVTVTTEKGWRKTLVTDAQGGASVQLVRDDYPASWPAFDRTRAGEVKFLAELRTDESGQLDGAPYDDTSLSATFLWRYLPARREYQSLLVGLLLGVFALAATLLGVFLYRLRRQTGLKRGVFHE